MLRINFPSLNSARVRRGGEAMLLFGTFVGSGQSKSWSKQIPTLLKFQTNENNLCVMAPIDPQKWPQVN